MKKLQKKKTTGSVLLTALICFSGALTSFAYAPVPIVEDAEWDSRRNGIFCRRGRARSNAVCVFFYFFGRNDIGNRGKLREGGLQT